MAALNKNVKTLERSFCGGDIKPQTQLNLSYFFSHYYYFFHPWKPLFIYHVIWIACDISWLWPRFTCNGAHVSKNEDVLEEKNKSFGFFGEDQMMSPWVYKQCDDDSKFGENFLEEKS